MAPLGAKTSPTKSFKFKALTGTSQGPAENEPFYTRRSTIYNLGNLSKPDVPVRALVLTQNIKDHRLHVSAAEFLPMPGDVTSYKWRDVTGEPRTMQMPNFCLTNIDEVHNNFCGYIESAKRSYLMSLEGEDKLAWMTVCTAFRYAQNRVCPAQAPYCASADAGRTL